MHRERAHSQDIRPLRILILNLMPTKIVTETQLARLLANSPLQVQLTFLQTATHSTTHTPPEHMKAFYKTFDAVKHERFDGLIITGAPVEDMDYEQVDYWDELCTIMEYSKENVFSTIHLCWGALAGLYYHFGVRKVHLDRKMFGVFEHRLTRPANPLVRGFDEVFYAPHTPLGRAEPRGHRRLRRAAHPGRERRGRTDAAFDRIGAADLCDRPPRIRQVHAGRRVQARCGRRAGHPRAGELLPGRRPRPRTAVPLARARVPAVPPTG